MAEKKETLKDIIDGQFLIKNFNKEIKEAEDQVAKMQENLQKWNPFQCQHLGQNQNQQIIKELENNQSHLVNKIKVFTNQLEKFKKEKLVQKYTETTIDVIIDECSAIQDKMKIFYEAYKILWAQQYYLTQRQLILYDSVQQEQYDLITYILS